MGPTPEGAPSAAPAAHILPAGARQVADLLLVRDSGPTPGSPIRRWSRADWVGVACERTRRCLTLFPHGPSRSLRGDITDTCAGISGAYGSLSTSRCGRPAASSGLAHRRCATTTSAACARPTARRAGTGASRSARRASSPGCGRCRAEACRWGHLGAILQVTRRYGLALPDITFARSPYTATLGGRRWHPVARD